MLTASQINELMGEYAGQQRPENDKVLKETPVHRLIVFLRAQGHTLREIAAQLDYSPCHVGNVLATPWAREHLQKLQSELGAGELNRLVENLGKMSLYKLQELIEADTTPANVKAQSAMYCVNRLLGKPKETLAVTQETNSQKLTDEQLLTRLKGVVSDNVEVTAPSRAN